MLLDSSNQFIYQVGDVFFYALHLIIISFNLFAWIWKETLKWHLIVVGLTLFSWIGIGIFYGFGYCFITDWHWDLKNKLGETGLPNSFVTYFFHSINIPMSPQTADIITMASFAIAIIASLYRNIKNR